MIHFESDYSEGCIPEILEALIQTNTEQTSGYGNDKHCENAKKLILEVCQCPKANVHFFIGGTQANLTVIASLLKPYQAVLCADYAHIHTHETGAIEAIGHKCIPLPSYHGILHAEQIEQKMRQHFENEAFENMPQPAMVYLSLPTETEILYPKNKLKEIYTICHKYQIALLIDGARLGYALCADENDLTLADIAKYSDIFYIGRTKLGSLFGEAVIIPNLNYQKDFRYHMKQRGALLAKGRLLGIQFEQLFTNN